MWASAYGEPLSVMRELTLAEASAVRSQLRLEPSPATLDPLYVAADAARSPSLRPVFLCYQGRGETWMHAFHVCEVPGLPWQDASSPYGYGGPLSSSSDPDFLNAAWAACRDWMHAHRVVVEFVRFHPLLANERFYPGAATDNRQVVLLDLQAGPCADGYAARLRSSLRKAEREGLRYEEGPLRGRVREFGAFYRAAMRDIGADSFYEFSDDYFEALSQAPLARLATCVRNGAGGSQEWLAASLLLESSDTLEYHLAGSSAAGRRVAAASYLLDQAARGAQERGLKVFYLGGGTSPEPSNSLLFFKGAFSDLRLTYRTGCTIYNPAAYEEIKARFAPQWARFPERPIFYRTA